MSNFNRPRNRSGKFSTTKSTSNPSKSKGERSKY